MTKTNRTPLNRDRVLSAAVALADDGGLESLSMRKLAQEFGVVPMALYKHVANRQALVDGMIDVVFAEIELPDASGSDWMTAMRRRAHSVRAALLRHRWAVGLMESRENPGPPNRRHHNATMGCLRESGLSLRDAIHVLSALDSYVYGFALQQKTLPFDTRQESREVVERVSRRIDPDAYPYLIEVTNALAKSGYSYDEEFEIGLDALLAGLTTRELDD
jgi:AcrR family transcriptional regulator